jgi:hypothetical protein
VERAAEAGGVRREGRGLKGLDKLDKLNGAWARRGDAKCEVRMAKSEARMKNRAAI